MGLLFTKDANPTHTSFFKNKVMFGHYPTQKEVSRLEKLGITVFVNLTNVTDDKIETYVTQKKHIHHPLPEGGVPGDVEDFKTFIKHLSDLLNSGEKIYIHCRHGRGRSGLVFVALLMTHYGLSYKRAIKTTYKLHRKGHGSSKKWSRRLIPTHNKQRYFVKRNF